jgi:hypothetical protein
LQALSEPTSQARCLHIAHASPGSTLVPPSASTRCKVAATSLTAKYGREKESPGPRPRAWTPTAGATECVCQPSPSPSWRASSSAEAAKHALAIPMSRSPGSVKCAFRAKRKWRPRHGLRSPPGEHQPGGCGCYALRRGVLSASATVPRMSRPPKSTRPGASSASPSTMAATPIAAAAAR